MSKRGKTNEKKIARQMRFRFFAAALICFAVITGVSFAIFQVYHSRVSEAESVEEEAADLSEEIDGIVVENGSASELKELKKAYDNLSGKQQQVTQQRYDKLAEAIRLAEIMDKEEVSLVVKDKSKNGFDMDFGVREKAELKAYGRRTAFEGQADVDQKDAGNTFDRLFDGRHSFTVEAELNPNDGNNFNMIMSKGDNCAAFRISEQSVYFFIKNMDGEWMGIREKLNEEQMHSWIHVAAIYNGNDISVYLEGTGIETVKNAGKILPSEFPLGIGYCPETKRISVSSIRRFHIYSQPLTEAELDQESYGPESDNVVLWYDFDDYRYEGLNTPAEGIRCYTESLQVEEGQTASIRAEAVPYYAQSELAFQSADDKTAAVSGDGTVTGLKKGSAAVTAAVKDTGFSVEIPVNVGGMFLSAEQMLEWFINHMILMDFVLFVFALLVIALIQRRQLISYLGRLTDEVWLIGKETGEPELPNILSDAGIAIREAEERFRKKDDVAREAEQRKNDLVVYLAHDLKTPIASLVGYLTLLRDEKQISPQLHQHYVEVALNNSERLDDLINELFDITRFNMSHITLNYCSTNLTWFLEQLVSEFQPMLKEKGLSCRLKVPKDLRIRCDTDKMERVFDNLLRNAVNYSYRETEICIEVTVGESVVITFTNQGQTIPKEQLGRIFEQFYRLDAARSSSTGNSGLGLAITKQIVELHRGSIRAESGNERIWFTVKIPHGEADKE